MANGVEALCLTFVLALVSATAFLLLRCQGVGRPFGGGSRWWAMAAILLTSALSTAAAVAGVALLRYVHPALLGVIAPSGLWLGQLRRVRADERQSRSHDAHGLGLTWLLDRMHQGMAEDRLSWCEERVDRGWRLDQLVAAGRFYRDYLKERLPPAERPRAKVDMRLRAIEDRLDIVRLIENGASPLKVQAALRASRFTKGRRYEKYRRDLLHLSDLLRHDAEQELIRMLSAGYLSGCYRLPVFRPSGRVPWREPDLPARPHP